MGRLIAVVMALVLGACATSYRDSYVEESNGPGRFTILDRVNGHTDPNAPLIYGNRRAAELCPGGYDVVDRGALTEGSYTLVVQCRVVATIATETRGAPSHGEWWCSVASNLPVGSCSEIRENCEDTRNALVRQGRDIQPCSRAEHAYCFRARVPLTPELIAAGSEQLTADLCSPQLDWCQREAGRTADVAEACRER